MLAFTVLLLFPGFLVVRAPWTAVPFLSLFFWIASWWWLPSVGRERLIAGALTAFALASLLRLVRLEIGRPAWPPLLVLATALLHCGIALVFGAGSGARLDPVAAQLMVWHDGLPATYVPLREAGDFGAHPHGLDGIAADVSLLSGAAVPRAVALAAAVARGLSSIGIYALLARLFAPAPAAVGTVGASVIVGLLASVMGGAGPAWSLALGFMLSAAGLILTGRSRSAAVAAGAFVGAAVMTGPAAAAAVLAGGLAVAGAAGRRIPDRDALRARLALAAAAAAATGAPYVWRAGMALARS